MFNKNRIKWNRGTRFRRPIPEMDWREVLQEMLIRAGTTGIKQGVIIERFAKWTTAQPILDELESLAILGKVQKFQITSPKPGRPPTIWRATSLILESDEEAENSV